MNPDKRAEIVSGSYVWPFEFVLPPRLPPTFNSAHGWIKYGIRYDFHDVFPAALKNETNTLRNQSYCRSPRAQLQQAY
jgi:hypothetical protein